MVASISFASRASHSVLFRSVATLLLVQPLRAAIAERPLYLQFFPPVTKQSVVRSCIMFQFIDFEVFLRHAIGFFFFFVSSSVIQSSRRLLIFRHLLLLASTAETKEENGLLDSGGLLVTRSAGRIVNFAPTQTLSGN